jgi:hypothetical protein
MEENKNKPTPVLTPLKENTGLFIFEKLKRNPPDERKKLDEVRTEASANKVFNNGNVHKNG